MNSPPNPPFWGTLGLSKSLTCGGFRGRFRNVATHRFILGFSNAEFDSLEMLQFAIAQEWAEDRLEFGGTFLLTLSAYVETQESV